MTPAATPVTSTGHRRIRSSIDEAALGVTIERVAPERYAPSEAVTAAINQAASDPNAHPGIAALATHRSRAQDYLAHGYQADFRVSELDIENLPWLIESENTRTPGLGLRYCPNEAAWRELIDTLLARAAQGHTSHVRVIQKAWGWGHHHAFADILAQPGAPLSVIEMEPVDHIFSTPSTLREWLAAWQIDHVINTILPRLQKSDNDCVIFCLSLALKAFDSRQAMRAMHARQLAGSLDATRESKQLAASFYKHAQSSSTLMWRLKKRPELGDTLTNKRGQGLRERYLSNLSKTHAGEIYSISIELKRLKIIDRAILHFGRAQEAAAEPAPQPGWLNKLKACLGV
ncbi:MAG: hypothetical protein RIR70_783 [Pseudomonadota bacterium]